MIDTHSHLLHKVDDGSSSIEESLTCLTEMADAGVTHCVLTPHYLRGGYDQAPQVLQSRFNELETAVKEAGISIKLSLGAEVYLTEISDTDIKNLGLTMGNTQYVLIELGFQSVPPYLYDVTYRLAKDGYLPILAHPERYVSLIQNPALAEELKHHNMYLQINAGSLLGEFGNAVRNTAWQIIENGHAHVVASDNHGKKPYPLAIAYAAISERLGEYTAASLCKNNPANIINNLPLDAVVPRIVPRHTWLDKLKGIFHG